MRVEVSKALTAMDIGPEITRAWNELDRFITTVVQSDRENVIERAKDLADRLSKPRSDWLTPCTVENGIKCPLLSILLPAREPADYCVHHANQHKPGKFTEDENRINGVDNCPNNTGSSRREIGMWNGSLLTMPRRMPRTSV